MKLLLVVALVHAAYGGNVRTSNLLTPAGVTYVDGSYHAGLAAGPLAYSSSISQPVFQSAAAAAPAVAVASQPIAVAAAPVAYAAPATKYAAIPTVQHVPGVADVPVTRINAQPTVIQKTVDVARPAVKTQRYEVRRPAIQKQFYDIEERVVVRPAGSALVELDEPLSKTQKGPSLIRPTGEAVAVSSSVAVSPTPAVTALPPAPPELPSVEINLARSSLPSPAPAVLPSVGFARNTVSAPAPAPAVLPEIARSSFAVAPAPAPASVSFPQTTFASSAPAPLPPAGYARTSFVASQPTPVPSAEVRTSYAVPAPSAEVRTSYAVPAPSAEVRTSYAVPAPSAEVRTSYAVPAPIQSVSYSAPLAAQSVGISAVPVKTVSVSAPIQTATVSGVSSVSSGVSGISSISVKPAEISVSTPAPQISDDSVSIDSADFSAARSNELAVSYAAPRSFAPSAQAPSQETIFRSQLPPRRFSGHSTSSARAPLIVNYPNAVDLIPQSRFSSGPVYSEGSAQSYINHENQQKLIQLLTARGGVTEVGYGRSGSASYPVEASQVRARVLSATPAPAYAAPTGERVNTRRVVVSRPIETLQEVEVNEPVTKFERVRVDQPAVVKTASQDVIRVPTSVPVYGKTLAPIAEAPVAGLGFSADWQ